MDDAQSIPLIRLFDNLIVSIQTALSDQVIESLMINVARTIEETQISGLILDLSGADILDSHATRRLHDLAVTARLMGVDTVLCGLRRSVVITLVEMGLSLSGMTTALSLERALEILVQRRYAAELARKGERGPSGEQKGDSGAGAQ
jgi:rsbT antagonist protein RsbS